MAHVRAPLDHIDSITVIESRVEDQASFNRFPNFLFYGGSSAIIAILERPNRDSDRALRAEYYCLLKLTVISFLRKVKQDIVFWSFFADNGLGPAISIGNTQDVYLYLRKYGRDVGHRIRLP